MMENAGKNRKLTAILMDRPIRPWLTELEAGGSLGARLLGRFLRSKHIALSDGEDDHAQVFLCVGALVAGLQLRGSRPTGRKLLRNDRHQRCGRNGDG